MHIAGAFLVAVGAQCIIRQAAGAQIPLKRPIPVIQAIGTNSAILDEAFDDWLKNLTSFWGMKGLSVAVVRRKEDGGWDVETKGYGVKNEMDESVTEDVSLQLRISYCGLMTRLNGLIHITCRRCSLLAPTLNFLLLLLSECS